MGSEFRWGDEMFGNVTSELLDDIEPSFSSLEDLASSCPEDEDMLIEDPAPLDADRRYRTEDRSETSARKSRLNRFKDSCSDDCLGSWASTPTRGVKKSRSDCLDDMLLEDDAFAEGAERVAYSTPVRGVQAVSKYDATMDWCDADASTEREEPAVECTPLRGSDKRRSVSLVDVSKIEPYTCSPLSNAMTSWETMGSQSSVGKSRDSGYMHCGSLASVSSSKGGLECSGADVSSAVEECTRLRRELEYSQVLINTLQDSNNQLRIKCAAAHSRISEMRHRSVKQHPTCDEECSKGGAEWSVDKAPVNCYSLYLDSSNSSEETTTEEEDDCLSDILQPLSTTRLSQNNSAKQEDEELGSCSEDLIRSLDSEAWSFKDSGLSTPRSQDLNNSCRISDRASSSSSREFLSGSNAEVARYAPLERAYHCSGDSAAPPVERRESLMSNNRGIEADANVVKSFSTKDLRRSHLESDRCAVDDEQTVPKTKESHVRSIENIMASLVSDDRNLTSDDSVFVANEVDGKVCVGKFQVWDKNVESPGPIVKVSTMPTVKVRSATPLLSDAESPVDLRAGPSGLPRVSPRCCRFKNGNVYRRSSPVWDSVRITISQSGSKCSRHSPMFGRDSRCGSRSALSDSSRASPTDPFKPFVPSRNSPLLRSDSRCGDDARVYSPVDSCRDNLSKLGVTVSKTALTALERWKTLNSKVKMERLRFGNGRTAPGDPCLEPEASRVGIATPLKPNRFAATPSPQGLYEDEMSTVSSPTDLGHCLKDTESSQPQTLEECMKRVCEYASELSRGIEKLPHQLESICQIGKQ